MSGITLRPYQQKAIDSIKSHLQKGTTKQIAVLATGLGKTALSVKLVEQLEFKRVLFIAHTEELIEQSGLAFMRDKFGQEVAKNIEDIGFMNWVSQPQNNSFKMGAIKADNFIIDADVTIASAQTLHRRLNRIPYDYFDLIICDEVHLYLSDSFSAPLKYFTPKLLLGLTATPHRADGRSFTDIFDKIVFEYNIGDGIKDGYLAQLEGIRVKTDLSLDNVRTRGGEFNMQDLSAEVDIPERNSLIVDSYLQYSPGRQGLFFCVDIQHSLNLAEEFRSRGISCAAVSSDEERTGDRKAAIKAFKRGEIMVLTNPAILTTGFDWPDTGVIGHCAPTKSIVKYLQCTGRATRLKSPEYVSKFKQQAVIIDYVDNTTKHKLVNAWALDSGKATEDKVFLLQEKKDWLISERENRKKVLINKTLKVDEKVDLFELPQVTISDSVRMQEPATDKQIQWLSALGYDTVNVTYTKRQCAEIISNQSASAGQIAHLKREGYDVSNGVTIAEYELAKKEIEKRSQKKIVAMVKSKLPNDGPYF